jgi:hypothetical protein
VCSESEFAAEIVLAVANQSSLLKIVLCPANQRSLSKIELFAGN